MTKSDKLIRRLNQLHNAGVSWKDISKRYLGAVKPGTLSRIAKGNYIPKDEKILFELGLKKPRQPRQLTPTQEAIKSMAADTRAALVVYNR